MKVVYTPKNPFKTPNVSINTEQYNCDAYEYFKEKRKDDLASIQNEINRREQEKYHLGTT
jgi:hypothetical protein